MTRDEFLAKKIGISFKKRWSKEKWFFIVWNWAKKQEWWLKFLEDGCYNKQAYMYDIIHLDRFADAVAHYLGWGEK